jgi:FAD/FMN-containing dehydrogenase/Fe-S oxidoreductase
MNLTAVTQAKPRPPHRQNAVNSSSIDAQGLEKELRISIRGEVRFSDGDRALYSTDSSNYRQIPIGVVIPRDKHDVIQTVAVCRRYGAPITGRGGGTSLAGQCCNVAVIIDFTKYMNRVLKVDPERKLVRVEPGIVCDEMQKSLKPYQLVWGPAPATHNHCALGGMLGNNSCGVHSVMAEFYGGGARTSDNVHELEILTYDGTVMRVGKTDDEEFARITREGGRPAEIYQSLRDLRDRYAEAVRNGFPKIPRRVSGYNLDDLLTEKQFHVARALVGTESTCVLILEATLEVMPDPPARSLLVIGYPDIYQAGDDVPAVRRHKPVGLEGIDDVLINAMKTKHIHPRDLEILPQNSKGWLIVEFGGKDREESHAKAYALMEELKKRSNPPTMEVLDDEEKEAVIWKIRDSGLGASARVPNEPDTWEGWEDSAVSPEDMGNYLRAFRALLDKYGYLCTLYGHFGQGLVHTRIDFGLKTHQGIDKYLRFTDEAADLIKRYGGSLSGEHGDGQSRGELLVKMFGPELVEAFQEFKAIWDPAWKMNPGKIVRPYHRNQNLRYGEHYDPPQWPTKFAYPEDKHSFSYAIERCVGVGKCRRHEGGTMCPSYMVTREEKHSTRGRARLLWEMLDGEVIGHQGWKDEHVKAALDLCLACKGCKAECPVNVDMATYKAEFLSHYYRGRLRPIHAYAFGLIHVWARLAQIAPSLVNFINRAPFLSRLTKALVGIAPRREMPAFAPESFRSWFLRRAVHNRGRSRVLLWPDTFNNYFHPATAKAAVEVLEDAGFQVIIPQTDLCCGRPLYDYGMLDRAKRWLAQILTSLREEIEAGFPMVGLEPSCTALFRDELMEMFPENENARRLCQQTYTLGEFLMKKGDHYRPPKLSRKALLHGHCHHKAIMKTICEEELLKEIGIDFDKPETGCCGMAGAFGFEADKYDVSIACGERVLLPAVRSAGKDTLVIADGFSCRTQIEETTDRRALHLAEVIKMAMDEGPRGPSGNLPERNYVQPRAPVPSEGKTLLTLALGALILGTVAGWIGGEWCRPRGSASQ